MNIKLLQLNIERGKHMQNIFDFLKQNSYDVLHFQEVTGGKIQPLGIDCFEVIQKNLGYRGELSIDLNLKNDPFSYSGNATFFKNTIICKSKQVLSLKEYKEIENNETFPAVDLPRSVLALELEVFGKRFNSINAHLAWSQTPHDTPEKLFQGEIFYNYLKTVKAPFVLSGDFNVNNDSQIVSWVNSIGRNLAQENKIENTLNPRLHKAKALFPKGLAVDYIFTDKKLQVKSFKVIEDIDLSDHLALSLEFEL